MMSQGCVSSRLCELKTTQEKSKASQSNNITVLHHNPPSAVALKDPAVSFLFQQILTSGVWHIQLSIPAAAQRWSCETCLLPSESTSPSLPVGCDILSQQAWRGTVEMIHRSSAKLTCYCKQAQIVAAVSQPVAENEGFSKNHLTRWTTRRGSLTGKRHLSRDKDSATN